MIRTFLDKRFTQPILRLLKQGVTPERIALSIALGITLGIFPVIGSTTLLCALAAIVFRLNLPAIQLVNYLMSPVQLILLIPFYHAGALLFQADPLPLSLAQIITMIHQNTGGAVRFLWDTTMRAIIVWLIVGPLATILFQVLLTPVVRGLEVRSSSLESD